MIKNILSWFTDSHTYLTDYHLPLILHLWNLPDMFSGSVWDMNSSDSLEWLEKTTIPVSTFEMQELQA